MKMDEARPRKALHRCLPAMDEMKAGPGNWVRILDQFTLFNNAEAH
jgi:hypothetical protein